MNNESQWIQIGFASKAHGVKGEFCAHLEAGRDTVLNKGHQILLTPAKLSGQKTSELPDKGLIKVIANIKKGHKIIMSLEEVSDRTRIENLLPFHLSLSRQQFPKSEEGEFYLCDLFNLEVINIDSNEYIGKISGFYNHGAGEIVMIECSGDVLELPLVEHFFPRFDLEDGKVWVKLPIEV